MLMPDDLDMELDEFVERFELAHADRPGIDVAEFLPSQQHPRYAHISCELLRVHMELSAIGRQVHFRRTVPTAISRGMRTVGLLAGSAGRRRTRPFELSRRRAGSWISESGFPVGYRIPRTSSPLAR